MDLVKAAIQAGADVIELGIPFSDPVADGPVIQASHYRALCADPKLNLNKAFGFLETLRKTHPTPVVFMSSVNLIFRYGPEAFFKKAKASGLDGVVIPDLLFEEAEEYLLLAKQHGVALILLVSTLCPPERLKAIVQASEGFLYLIATTGTTGERDTVSQELPAFVRKIKKIKPVPVAIGFGIATKAHVDSVCSYAEGAIIGSRLVRMIEDHQKQPEAAVAAVASFIASVKA